METHELCPSCKPLGECMFVKKALGLKRKAERWNDKSPKNQEDALLVNNAIAQLRKEAQEKACPNEYFDPIYPGRNLI